MKVLRARLWEVKREEKEKQMAELRGEYIKAEWGSQIRSYVFCPYTLVKDHRSNHENGNVMAVMDGALDDFILAFLSLQNKGRS